MEPFSTQPTRLKLSEVKGIELNSANKLFISDHSATEKINISVNSVYESMSSSLQLELKHADEVLATAIIQITDQPTQIFSLADSVSIKFSRLKAKKQLQLFNMPPKTLSTCEYLKKLQEIEGKEREIMVLLADSKQSLPDVYKEILDSSPRSAAKRPLLKKRTLEVDNFAEFFPDFSFESYFNVNLESVSSNEANLLETAVIGLINKIRGLRFDVEDYEMCQETLLDFDVPTQNLIDSVKESKEQLGNEEKKAAELSQRIALETSKIESEISEVDGKNTDLFAEIQKIVMEIDEISKSNQELVADEVSQEIAFTSDLRRDLAKVLDEIAGIEKFYEKVTGEFGNSFPEQELAAVINEKIMKLSELQRVTNARDFALQEGIQLKTEYLIAESEVFIEEDLAVQTENYKNEASSSARNTKHIYLQLQEVLEESHTSVKNSQDDIEKCTESLQPLSGLEEKYGKTLLEKQEASLKNSEELEEILKNNSQLEEILYREKQIISEFQDFKNKFLNSNLIQNNVLEELENQGNSLLSLSETSLTTGRLLRKADDMIEEQELQQVSMHRLISLIKQTKPAHIAVQNDPTDMALAKYLNSRHKTLDVPFKRTEKDKYVFGTLKVDVKSEGEIFVIVEGKKIQIEEFLEGYLQTEKEKTFKRSNSKVQEKKEAKPALKIGKSPLIPLGQILRKAK